MDQPRLNLRPATAGGPHRRPPRRHPSLTPVLSSAALRSLSASADQRTTVKARVLRHVARGLDDCGERVDGSGHLPTTAPAERFAAANPRYSGARRGRRPPARRAFGVRHRLDTTAWAPSHGCAATSLSSSSTTSFTRALVGQVGDPHRRGSPPLGGHQLRDRALRAHPPNPARAGREGDLGVGSTPPVVVREMPGRPRDAPVRTARISKTVTLDRPAGATSGTKLSGGVDGSAAR